jgi:hypothetical protein
MSSGTVTVALVHVLRRHAARRMPSTTPHQNISAATLRRFEMHAMRSHLSMADSSASHASSRCMRIGKAAAPLNRAGTPARTPS